MIVIVSAVVFALVNAPQPKEPPATSNVVTPIVSDGGSTPDNGAEPVASATPLSAEAPAPATVEPSRPEDQVGHPTPPTDEPRTGDTTVADATAKALDQGSAEAWTVGADHGFVTVSAAQDYGNRVCRNVYSTLNSHGERSRSADVMWCRSSSGGRWTVGQ